MQKLKKHLVHIPFFFFKPLWDFFLGGDALTPSVSFDLIVFSTSSQLFELETKP